MKTRTAMAIAAAAFASCLLRGEDLATSTDFGGIFLNTAAAGAPILISSLSGASILSDHPVRYRAGETVTAIAPDGSSTTLNQGASAAGSVAFAPDADGSWRLVNSSGDEMTIGVAWNVFGSDWTRDFASGPSVVMDTHGEGPDRRGRRPGPFPGIAYTGDGWVRGASAASTLTLTPPDGADAQVLALSGTGTVAFNPSRAGVWTLRLAYGSTTLESLVTLSDAGTVIYMR